MNLFELNQYGDVTAAKHGGSETSLEANEKLDPYKDAQRERVYHLVAVTGRRGATSKEIATSLKTGLHNISGRLSELLLAGRIDFARDSEGRKLKRDGAAVLVIREVK